MCVGNVIAGDNPGVPEECTDWYQYTYYDYQWVCYEIEEEGGNDCGIGMSAEECACMMYGIGCGDGGYGGDDPPPPIIINNVDDPCIHASV